MYYTKEGTSKIKGSIFAISVLLLVIITGSGCVHSTWTSQEPQPLETEPEPAPGQAPEIQSPVPIEEIEKPRELTQVEIDAVIEIALSTPEASERIARGEPYRTEIIWVANEGTEWRSHNYNIKNEEAYDAEWYPGVMIGFGSPQEWLIAVAADLAADKAIHVESFADVPRVESNLEYLNEEQKTRIVEIACEAVGVSEQSAHKVEYVWIGISEDSKYTLEYEVVEKGIPEYAWSEMITYYPGVRFILGSSVIKVAINLDTDEVVFRDGFPARKGPVPAR